MFQENGPIPFPQALECFPWPEFGHGVQRSLSHCLLAFLGPRMSLNCLGELFLQEMHILHPHDSTRSVLNTVSPEAHLGGCLMWHPGILSHPWLDPLPPDFSDMGWARCPFGKTGTQTLLVSCAHSWSLNSPSYFPGVVAKPEARSRQGLSLQLALLHPCPSLSLSLLPAAFENPEHPGFPMGMAHIPARGSGAPPSFPSPSLSIL